MLKEAEHVGTGQFKKIRETRAHAWYCARGAAVVSLFVLWQVPTAHGYRSRSKEPECTLLRAVW
ncbi:hypothetical protein IMCC12053_1629 [Celeribacter marinus]|uniref:Uncharacterized protein n=1 Tax=Celeribacter marinus TaxID=1397108 RepID=A0A0N9ZPQ4_9RHOB|nr:hypothetical protein IMCC12053_1629 [Celeribacter marinus]